MSHYYDELDEWDRERRAIYDKTKEDEEAEQVVFPEE